MPFLLTIIAGLGGVGTAVLLWPMGWIYALLSAPVAGSLSAALLLAVLALLRQPRDRSQVDLRASIVKE